MQLQHLQQLLAALKYIAAIFAPLLHIIAHSISTLQRRFIAFEVTETEPHVLST
jgi:hypothetical protein